MSVSPENYVNLAVQAADSPFSRYAAAGPQTCANRAIEAALQTGVDREDLLDRLHAGNLAVRVVYGPEDFQASRIAHIFHFIGRSLVADGNTLVVQEAVPKARGTELALRMARFRRNGPEQPYLLTECQTDDTILRVVPNGKLSDEALNTLHGMRLGAELVDNGMQSERVQSRVVPYVRITDAAGQAI